MRLKIYSVLAVVIICLSYFSFAGSKNAKGLPDRDPKLAVELVETKGAILLDVRTLSEWNDGYIKGAKHIPINELQTSIEKVDKLVAGDKKKPIVIYCRSGGRAGLAKKLLQKAGYTQVTNLGGLRDWPKKDQIQH